MSRAVAARTLLLACATGLTVLGACDRGATGVVSVPVPQFPARMQITGGEDQTAAAGTALPQPLTVRVLDAAGVPIGGQVVNFRVVSGGGSVFAGAAITDAQGRAAERWTLGTVAADSQRVEARAVNPATGAALTFATFKAVATPGALSALARLGPDSQSVAVASIVPIAPAVRATDRFGNPVRNVRVTFAVAAGGGVLSDSVSTSDSTGVARVARWTTGPDVGANQVTASATGIPPVLFNTTTSVAACSGATSLKMTLGEVRSLNTAQKTSLCLGGESSAAEYVLIPFNTGTVAASVVPFTITATGVSPSIAPPAVAAGQLFGRAQSIRASALEPHWSDAWIRERERYERPADLQAARRFTRARLTNIPSNPEIGSIHSLHANSTGNLCTSAKQPRPARVVAVLSNTIVFIDTLSPAGGFTDAELQAFGASFDTLGFALDTANFGAPTDIDGNGRVAIFFTPEVNATPAPQGVVVGGYFAARDLFSTNPTTGCVSSNEGEIFYMPVPDPARTINGNYTSKSSVSGRTFGTLVHEMQHLINAGRRIHVNNASNLEEVWLNEGLSHIAEELLYYRVSGNSPRSDISLEVLLSSQAQLDAANSFIVQNMVRLSEYMLAPETNAPFADNNSLATRGAIWQLLRYSADRKGGDERSLWRALVNSNSAGQLNFNAAFGNIIDLMRDWAVAQFADDAALGVTAQYTNPSWNYRSVLPALNDDLFPLRTQALVNGAVPVSLNGGSAAYYRFRVAGGALATLSGASANGALPARVEWMLVRTQ